MYTSQSRIPTDNAISVKPLIEKYFLEKMNIIQCDSITNSQKKAIFNIWNTTYPNHLVYSNHEDFEDYLSKLDNPSHLLYVNDNKQVLGWLISFDRDNERWFTLLVSEKDKGKGIGSKLIEKAKNIESILNGWVIDHDEDKKLDGKRYKSPLKFYEKHNFRTLSSYRFENGKLSAVKITWTGNP